VLGVLGSAGLKKSILSLRLAAAECKRVSSSREVKLVAATTFKVSAFFKGWRSFKVAGASLPEKKGYQQ
jgi:hypothetical protein